MIEIKNIILVLMTVLFLFTVIGCYFLIDDELEMSEDFMGLEVGARWEYISVGTDDGEDIDVAWAREVVGKEIREISTIFAVEYRFPKAKLRTVNKTYGGEEEILTRYWIRKVNEYRVSFDNNSMNNVPPGDPRLIVKKPISKGDTGFMLFNSIGREMIAIKKEIVSVPAGEFEAWLFSVEHSVEDTDTDETYFSKSELWFAPYVGIVKTEEKAELFLEGERLFFVEIKTELIDVSFGN